MKHTRPLVLVILLLLACVPAFAQGTTSAITGTATHDGAPLPGVTVVISSPALQGTRTAVTNEAGVYNFGALPPGEYSVVFEMEGMEPITRSVTASLAQTSRTRRGHAVERPRGSDHRHRGRPGHPGDQ